MRGTLPSVALLVGVAAACGGGSDRSPAVSTERAHARADSLLRVGEGLLEAEHYDSARVVLSLARRGAAVDSPTQVRTYLALAEVELEVGRLPEARALGERALEVITRQRMSTEISRAHRILGLVAHGEGRNADALRAFQQALTAARAVGNKQDELRAVGNLGLAQGNLGDYEGARVAHREVRMAARSLGDSRVEGKGLANEAMIDIWEGDARSAIERLDTARILYRRTAYNAGEEHALGQLATAYELTGEENRSFALLDSALDLSRKLGMVDEELDNVRLLAGLHLRLGDTRRALEIYRDAEARMRKAGLTANLASLLRGSAEANLRLGNLTRADEQLREALARHDTAGELGERLDDLVLATELDQRLGQRARVEERLRDARSLADRLNTRGARVSVAVVEATVADLQLDAPRVLRALQTAAPDMVPGDYGSEWITQALAARAYARLGRLDSAVVAGRRAVAAVERLRGNLASDALKSSYVVDRAEVYGDLVLTLLRLGRPTEAFAVADAARSRALLEYVGTTRARDRSLGTQAEIVESEMLLRRIDALMQRLRATEREAPRERSMLVSDPSAAIMEELTRTRARYEALLVRAAQSRTRVTAILGARESRIEELQRALRPTELLLEYMLAGSELVTFAVTRTELRVFRGDFDRPSLTQRVWLLRDLWGTGAGDWRDGLPASRALYDALIAPVEDADMLRGVSRLVIVPLGVMTQVPFAALTRGQDDDFLVRRYEVVLQPSSQSLAVLRDDSSRVASGSLPGEAFAPFPINLPATEREAAAFRASSSGWKAHVGRDATELAVRHAMGTAAVVHVATHGVVNARNPVFSRIELARPSPATLDDDGRLEVHEILGLTIRSPLVFLSGCETGANRGWSDDPVRGTGDLTLAQAVLAAGAPNVITTLWRIDDAGAAEFAARFYRRLQASTVASALAEAQREMAADPRYASPYYWAGYTLSGTGDLRPQSKPPSSVSQSSHAGGHRTFSRSSP